MQRCEECSYESKSIQGLSRHMKQKHGLILSTPKNTCSHCKRVFTTSRNCATHIEKRVCFPKEEDPKIPPPIETDVIMVEETPLLESFPIAEEHPQIESFPIMEPIEQKKKGTFGHTLIKMIICSVFFLPFFIRDTHIA